jgi:cell division protein FtsI/penicillin-binding protein 2
MKMFPLHNRAAILLFFLFLWAALVAAHLFYYSIIASDKYVERGNAIAKRTGVIGARAGIIFDAEGNKLVWTERRIDLYVDEVPEFPFYRNRLERAIAKYFIDFKFTPGEFNRICLQKNLSPIQQLHYYSLVKRFPEVIFKEVSERKYISEELKPCLRKIEEKYRRKIEGKDGIFEVMADRNGRWIPKTWNEKIRAVDGDDVIVNLQDIKR